MSVVYFLSFEIILEKRMILLEKSWKSPGIFSWKLCGHTGSSSNWLECSTEVDCYLLILILIFINLKFSKLAEIWYRGTLLYPYYNFNIYFFKKFFIHIFLSKFGPKMLSFSNWLKFVTEVDYYMVISSLLFIFSKFLSFILSLVKFGPRTKSEVLQIDWYVVQGCIAICLLEF